MTPISEERLAEIEAREQAATKGPWAVERRWSNECEIVPRITCAPDAERGCGRIADMTGAPYLGHDRTLPNSTFIAHARQDVPELVAALRYFTTLPTGVAAAMERYARHIESENCAASSPYFDAHGFDDLQRLTDVLAIAAHFTTLFTKGNQP